MSKIFQSILDLIDKKEVRVSSHGYDELSKDNIFVKDIVSSVTDAYVVEEYPNYPKGPCVLVLQKDNDGRPLTRCMGNTKKCQIARCFDNSI